MKGEDDKATYPESPGHLNEHEKGAAGKMPRVAAVGAAVAMGVGVLALPDALPVCTAVTGGRAYADLIALPLPKPDPSSVVDVYGPAEPVEDPEDPAPSNDAAEQNEEPARPTNYPVPLYGVAEDFPEPDPIGADDDAGQGEAGGDDGQFEDGSPADGQQDSSAENGTSNVGGCKAERLPDNAEGKPGANVNAASNAANANQVMSKSEAARGDASQEMDEVGQSEGASSAVFAIAAVGACAIAAAAGILTFIMLRMRKNR